MKRIRKDLECKTKQVKIRYFFWRRVRHNYFTSLNISLNSKRWIISVKTLIVLYENLIKFTQSFRVLWIYARLRNAELVLTKEALYFRFFTQELKIRKFWISCCERHLWYQNASGLILKTVSSYLGLCSHSWNKARVLSFCCNQAEQNRMTLRLSLNKIARY